MGEVIKEPVKDLELFRYFKERQLEIPLFPVVKIKRPLFLVYPYQTEDQIINIEEYLDKKQCAI